MRKSMYKLHPRNESEEHWHLNVNALIKMR